MKLILKLKLGIMAAMMFASLAQAQEPLKLGLIAPFSGNYAIFGEGYERGMQVWRDMYGEPTVSGRKVEVRKIDERCDVNTGLAAYRRESADLIATIGPSCSAVVRALAPIMEAAKKPSLFLGHASSLTMDGKKDGYLFRLSQPDGLILAVFGDFIIPKWKSEGKTKIAVIHDTTVTFQKAGEIMRKSAAQHGVEISTVQTFDLGTKDFTGQILNVKRSGAQAVVVVSYAADEGRLLRQAVDLNIGIPVAGGVDTPYLASIEKELVEGRTAILEGLYFYSDYVQGGDNSEIRKFDAAYRKRYNLPPLDINYEGWLAMSIMVKALQAPGALQGGERLRQAIQNTSIDLGGRTISFLENGDQANLLTYIGQIRKGNPELLQLIVSPRNKYPMR